MWKPTSVSTFDLKGLRVSLKELLQAWQSAYQIAPSINCDLSETCNPSTKGSWQVLLRYYQKTLAWCERCWHFRSYCFPQGISTVAALQCGLVTAGPRGLPFPLLPVAVILTICGLIWKSWPVSFHPKEDFVCKMGFHGSGLILISFKKKKIQKKIQKKGRGEVRNMHFFIALVSHFCFSFIFHL